MIFQKKKIARYIHGISLIFRETHLQFLCQFLWDILVGVGYPMHLVHGLQQRGRLRSFHWRLISLDEPKVTPMTQVSNFVVVFDFCRCWILLNTWKKNWKQHQHRRTCWYSVFSYEMLGNIPIWWNCTIQAGNKWRVVLHSSSAGQSLRTTRNMGAPTCRKLKKIDRENDDKHDKPVDGMVFSYFFPNISRPKELFGRVAVVVVTSSWCTTPSAQLWVAICHWKSLRINRKILKFTRNET